MENLPDFNQPDENKTGIIKWMWWLYIAVGLFVVCLLIWIFVALSKHQTDQQITEPWTENVSNISTQSNPD